MTPHPTENKAFCIECNKSIRYCKTDLIQHSQTVRYNKNINSPNYKAIDNVSTSNLSHTDSVKRAEIKLAAFFAEHNVAFYVADHLVPLIKDICINPQVVRDLSLARSKCANIVKNVIAKREIEKIV